MDNLSLVAAIGQNNELGLRNHLIWRIKEDLDFYKEFTMYQNIIMGRKTFESMPINAMKNRNVYVLSSKRIDLYCDVNSFTDVESLIKYINIHPEQHFIVVGGAQIYKVLLPFVDTMYLTEIDANSKADTYFPYIDSPEWDVSTIYYHTADYSVSKDVSYVRNRYTRKKVK